MRCNIPKRYNKKELEVMSNMVDEQVQKSLCKVQWLMILAYNRVCGIGEQRVLKVMETLAELAEEYGGWKPDGVADEILENAIKEVLPNSFEGMYKGMEEVK